MYNGVGVPTPRGTGTNGYVQRNLSHIRAYRRFSQKPSEGDKEPSTRRVVSEAVASHEARRGIEVELMKIRIRLEEEGMSKEEITEKLKEERSRLEKDRRPVEEEKRRIMNEKVVSRDRMANALGIGKERHERVHRRDRPYSPPRERNTERREDRTKSKRRRERDD